MSEPEQAANDSGLALTILDIYNNLFAGKQMEMWFPDAKARDDFRRKLHQMKLQQERQAVAVGMLQEEERQQLKFLLVPGTTIGMSYRIFLTRKPEPKKYTVTFID